MALLRIILAVILPPLGVFMQAGMSKHFWTNILPMLFGCIVHPVRADGKPKSPNCPWGGGSRSSAGVVS